MSVVQADNKGSAKDSIVMQLLRSLWILIAYYNIELTCVHIMGAANTNADHLSQNNLLCFFSLNPQALLLPTTTLTPLLQIAAFNSPDWTSPNFRKPFKATVSKA